MLALAVSCAKQAPPPGGPEDKTPPLMVGSEPEAGATGVSRTAAIGLTFSEKLDRRSFERGLAVNPRVRWSKMSWSGQSVRLEPLDSLYADTTYVVTVGAGVKDRRTNIVGVPIAVAFSTGSTVDGRVLVGKVIRSGKPVARAAVWLYTWRNDRDIDPEVDVPYRQTETDADGDFVLPFLRPAYRAYQVFAFSDANRTGAFEEGDPAGFSLEPLTVPALPETTGGVEVSLWDSARSGSISGDVLGEWEPEGAIWIRVMVPGDSVATVSRQEKITGPGPFRLGGIPAGRSVLQAYQDLNDNGQWDETLELREPGATLVDTLDLKAGETVRGVELRRSGEGEE